MKRVISKEVYDTLSDVVKSEYELKGDVYILKLDDYEDPAELKRARDREKEEARVAKEEARVAKEELDRLKHKGAKDNNDINAIEDSWRAKVTTVEQDRDTKLAKKNGWIQKTLIDNVALKLAGELSDSPTLILPHIKSRLTADFDADEPVTRVLDATGKPSALTLAELRAEFEGSKDFSSIIRGSKANGGGAAGNHAGGGGAKKPSEMNDAERIKLAKDNPTEFRRLFGENEFYTT